MEKKKIVPKKEDSLKPEDKSKKLAELLERLADFHSKTDNKLCEIKEMCVEKSNER